MSFDQNFFFDSSGKVVATEGLTTVRRPWEVRASSRYQGRYYFFNLDTGASEWSLDKTEIVGAPESKSFDAGGGGGRYSTRKNMKGSMSTNNLASLQQSSMNQESKGSSMPSMSREPASRAGGATPTMTPTRAERKEHLVFPSLGGGGGGGGGGLKQCRSVASFGKLYKFTDEDNGGAGWGGSGRHGSLMDDSKTARLQLFTGDSSRSGSSGGGGGAGGHGMTRSDSSTASLADMAESGLAALAAIGTSLDGTAAAAARGGATMKKKGGGKSSAVRGGVEGAQEEGANENAGLVGRDDDDPREAVIVDEAPIEVLSGLGQGGYAVVVLVRQTNYTGGDGGDDKDATNQQARGGGGGGGGFFAMKVIEKSQLKKKKTISRLKLELRAMTEIAPSPFLQRCHMAFESDTNVFFVLDHVAGGDLFFHVSYPSWFW